MLKYFCYGNKSEQKVSLTFDDGPNPYGTLEVLNILDKFNVKGSFFLIGKYIDMHPEIVREIVKRGHFVGNHTYSHEPPIKIEDFIKNDKILNDVLGTEVKYIRFPFGIRNNIKFAHDWDIEYLKKKVVIDFNCNSKDWKATSVKDIFINVLSNIDNGSIIDFHDSSEIESELRARHRKMIHSLPKIITSLKERNFDMVRIDQLDFNNSQLNIIITTLEWGGQTHKLIYTDSDDFSHLPQDKIKQVYGICFYNDKLVIGWNQKTKMWNFQGGSLKRGETYLQALKREIQEESNMEVLSYRPLGYQLSINPQGETIYQLRFACKVRPFGSFKSDPDGAVTKVKLINPEDYKRYIDWGELGDCLMERSIRVWNKKYVSLC